VTVQKREPKEIAEMMIHKPTLHFELINAVSLRYAFKGPIRHPLIQPHLIYNTQVLFIWKTINICQNPKGLAAIPPLPHTPL